MNRPHKGEKLQGTESYTGQAEKWHTLERTVGGLESYSAINWRYLERSSNILIPVKGPSLWSKE